jgi:hypothetical protein
MNALLIRRIPSRLVPIAMSLVALAMVLGHAALFGAVHEVDEGAAAHLFQLLMVAQVPFVVFFAARWLPRLPKQAQVVLVLQACAGMVALAAAYWLT